VAIVAVAMSGLVGCRGVWQYVVSLHRVQYHAGMEDTWRWLDQIGRDLLQAMDQIADPTEEERRATGVPGRTKG